MNLIFCGTPRFAVPTLERLIAEGFAVRLVVTNPDEPRGRGYERQPPPVKEAALRAGIRVFQPVTLKDPAVRNEFESIRSDAIVVVAYGHLIPQWLIDVPPLGCINLHASLLPAYRGAAPINWAILRGERVTGVTTMKIDAGLDTGDILLQKPVEIESEDTAETLSARLGAAGAALMAETLRQLERGQIRPRPQDHRLATLAPMLRKEDGRIDWTATAQEIARQVRALVPWPTAHTTFRGRNLQIWKARPAESGPALAPGELSASRRGLIAGCGGIATLDLVEVQLEGRKRMAAQDFANGMRLRAGERLGA